MREHGERRRSRRLLGASAAAIATIAVFSLGMIAAARELAPYRWGLIAYYALLPYYQKVQRLRNPAQTRYLRARDANVDSSLTAEQRAQVAELRAIGYVAGSAAPPERSGVTVHDRSRTSPGLNLYSDGHAPEAVLMDMQGVEIHRWSFSFEDAFPDSGPASAAPGRLYWRRVRLLPNGDLLAIYNGSGLIQLDSASRLRWTYAGQVHHDLDISADGHIYVLTRRAEVVPRIDPIRPVLHDFVSGLDRDGREVAEVSLLDAIAQSEYATTLGLRIHKPDRVHGADLLHTNTLEILDGSLSHVDAAFAAGNVLVSIRELSLIAVLDMAEPRIVWARSGVWARQHQPTVLRNGNLLLFDNLGDGGQSQVLEFDPVTIRRVWAYRGSVHPFRSATCGSNQRLPNGNTLITESDNGRAFEVTPDGSIVWEYYTPYRTGEDRQFIAALFEMIRLEPDFPLAWLPQPVVGRPSLPVQAHQ